LEGICTARAPLKCIPLGRDLYSEVWPSNEVLFSLAM